jgi:hypothetical protein
MIKIAMQSVVSCAADPGAVLHGLNRMLWAQLRGRLVTAAYLWLDTKNHTARYSAAGHPPLLHWRQGTLELVVSNGLLFGIFEECDYPVREMATSPATGSCSTAMGLSNGSQTIPWLLTTFRTALDQLDFEIQKIHEEAALAA